MIRIPSVRRGTVNTFVKESRSAAVSAEPWIAQVVMAPMQ